MFVFRYSDPPTSNTQENNDKTIRADNVAIGDYVLRATWSGDIDQAARKLEFSIAYNTAEKDAAFTRLDLKLGGTVEAFERDEETARETRFFVGHIFYRKRSTDGFTFEFVAYDNMIYLAKSKTSKLLEGTVDACIKDLCAGVKISIASIPPIPTAVSFFADDKSYTEMFKMLFEKARADPNVAKEYRALIVDDKIVIVPKGEMLDDPYVLSDKVNVIRAEHAESIEDMVNQVVMTDKHGSVQLVYTNMDNRMRYGLLSAVYKEQPPKKGETVDNERAAKAMLKGVKNESSLEGIGSIQAITGYTVRVQEERLKGKFHITADTHTFENNVHTMRLTLEYLPDTEPAENIAVTSMADMDFSDRVKKGG